ncbi:hypothetical protein T09_7541 [Trichinella sp. T9]|nr:hypothetical protein T09_7541 [Trichinella sp. T9]
MERTNNGKENLPSNMRLLSEASLSNVNIAGAEVVQAQIARLILLVANQQRYKFSQQLFAQLELGLLFGIAEIQAHRICSLFKHTFQIDRLSNDGWRIGKDSERAAQIRSSALDNTGPTKRQLSCQALTNKSRRRFNKSAMSISFQEIDDQILPKSRLM